MTFVALSITAQQLSPRILDFVLRERMTQVLVGLALATFLFATISLANSPSAEPARFGIAVPIALPLATATLAFVVLFVHAMTRVMRSEEMVARLGKGFTAAARSLVDGPSGCRPVQLPGQARAVIDTELGRADPVSVSGAGYVAQIDYAGLIRLAETNDLVIAVDVRENDHLLTGERVARVLGLHSESGVGAAEISEFFALGDRRTPAWGAGYEAAALSEAALRALSPGVNDPATALSCVNRLVEGMAILASEGPPPTVFGADSCDNQARVARLLLPSRGVEDFLESALLPVAVAGQRDYRIRRRLAGALTRLAELARETGDRRAIEAFALRVAQRADPVFDE